MFTEAPEDDEMSQLNICPQGSVGTSWPALHFTWMPFLSFYITGLFGLESLVFPTSQRVVWVGFLALTGSITMV